METAMNNFSYVLGGAYNAEKIGQSEVKFWVSNLERFRETADSYMKWASNIMSNIPADSGFIIPSGYSSVSGGHMVTVHLKKEDETNWVVTYANSGDGLHHHIKMFDNNVVKYRLIQSYKVDADVAKKVLAALLQNQHPYKFDFRIGKPNDNIHEFYTNTFEKTGVYEGTLLDQKQLLENVNEAISSAYMGVFGGNILHISNGWFMPPQITGTCTFHSMMWMLFYLCGGNLGKARALEAGMRTFTIDNLGNNPAVRDVRQWSGEDMTCIRIFVKDFKAEYGKLEIVIDLDDALRTLNMQPKGEQTINIDTNMRSPRISNVPGSIDDFASVREFAQVVLDGKECTKDTTMGLSKMAINLCLGLAYLMGSKSDMPYSRLECGTSYVSVVLNLACAMAIGCLEHICRLKLDCPNITGEDATVMLQEIAECVIRLYPLFESREESPAGHNFRDRYRAVLPKLLIMAIRINECTPGADQLLPLLLEEGNGIELKKEYKRTYSAFQYVRSAEDADKIIHYLPYAYITKLKNDNYATKYWTKVGEIKATDSFSPFKCSTLYEDEQRRYPNFVAYSDFIGTNMRGRSIATLVTLLRTTYIGRSDALLCFPYDIAGAKLYPYITQTLDSSIRLYVNSPSSKLELFVPDIEIESDRVTFETSMAMDDIVRIAQGQESVDEIICDDLHLGAGVNFEAGTRRRGFGYDRDVVIGADRRINTSSNGLDGWDAYQRRVFLDEPTQLAAQIPSMNARSLVYVVTKWWYLVRHVRTAGYTYKDDHVLVTAIKNRRGVKTKMLAIKVACILGPWALGSNDDELAPEDIQVLQTFLERHAGAMAEYKEAHTIWAGECQKNTDPAVTVPRSCKSQSGFLLCRLILEWIVSPPQVRGTIWFNTIKKLVPPLQLSTGTNDGTSSIIEISSRYTLPVWFKLRFNNVDGSTVIFDGDKYIMNLVQDKRFFCKVTREIDKANMVCNIDRTSRLGVLVGNLNRAGFGCTVWSVVETNGGSISVIFSDWYASDRIGEVRCHLTKRWELRWMGQIWELEPDDEVPANFWDWATGYKGGAVAFWVRPTPSGAPGRTALPQLLVMTAHGQILNMRSTVFNIPASAGGWKLDVPVRTMVFSVQAGGGVISSSTDDMLLLYLLCCFSGKDRCIARLYWSAWKVVSTIYLKDENMKSSPLAHMIIHEIRGKDLGHPYKYVLEELLDLPDCLKIGRSETNLQKRGWVLSAMFTRPADLLRTLGPSPPNGVPNLVATRLLYDKNKCTWSLDEMYISSPGDEAKALDMMRAGWESVHARSYLDSIYSQLGSDHHRAVWYARVLEAYWATRDEMDPLAVAMVASRVHPAMVRDIGAERSDVEMLFEVARGMFLNNAQIEELNKVWPGYDKPDTPPPPAKIFQAVMGMGKSAVLIPFLVLRSLQSDQIRCVVVVQPEHLVNDARTMMFNLFAALGGSYGPGAADRVRLVDELEYDMLKRCNWYGNGPKVVAVVSDTHLKQFYLTSLKSGSQTYKGTPSVKKVLEFESTMVIYDEIDSMWTPLRSEFNVPDISSKCFHPMEPEEAQGGSKAWRVAYGQYIVGTVDAGDDEKTVTSTPTGLDGKLTAKITADIRALKGQALNFHFGSARDEQVMLAVPYKAVRTPMDRSAFSDIDITAVLTYRTKKEEGLLERDFRLMKQHVAEWQRNISGGEGLLDTIFQHCTGTDVLTYRDLMVLPERELAGNIRLIKNNEELIRYYVVHVLFPRFLTFYKSRSNISFIDVMNISQYKLGFSGTVAMKVPEFPLGLSLKPSRSDQTSTPSNSFDTIISASLSTSEEIEKAIVGNQCALGNGTIVDAIRLEDNVTAVVDAAAVWKDSTVHDVYDMIKNVLDKREGWEGGWSFVYVDDQDRPRELLPQASKEKWDESATREYRRPDPSRKTFYYFDQRHSRGTDLVLPSDARAVVTFDLDRTTLSDVAQAAFRLRWINRGQTARYLAAGHEKVSGSENIYKKLAAKEQDILKQQTVRHLLQNYKAVRRWEKIYSSKGLVNNDLYKDIFIEPTPYSLTTPRNPTSDSKPGISNVLKGLLGQLTGADGVNNSNGVLDTEQNSETQKNQQTEQEKEIGMWGQPDNCLHNFVPNDHYVKSWDLGTDENFIKMNISLSPMLYPRGANETEPPHHRVFRYIASGRITILTLREYLAEPSRDEGWREQVYDRYGSPVGPRPQQPPINPLDRRFILGRLICGAHLDIAEEVYLLHDLGEHIADLHHVLRCLHQNKFFTVTEGYLLDQFIKDKNMGDEEIGALVEKYSDPVTLATALLVPTGGTFSQEFITSLVETPQLVSLVGKIKSVNSEPL